VLQEKKPNKRGNSCKRLLNETRGFITAVKSFFKEKAGCVAFNSCVGFYGLFNRCEFSNSWEP